MTRKIELAMTTAAFAFVIALTVVTPKTSLGASDDLYLYPKSDDLTTTETLSAKSGACDGFHRCRCGVTAARRHGLPLNYNGLNLKQASSWYAFARTSCHAGAVGIPHAHHVYTVEQCHGDGTALVSDERGTYTRRVAGNVFVDPNGNATTRVASHRVTRTYSARSHHRRYYQQVAYHYEMRDPARIGW